MTTTPNMGLVIPVVEVTVGPDWATQINEAFDVIDAHDHSSGDGVKVTPTGLNINANLSMGSNTLTNTRAVRFVDQDTQFSAVADVGTLYVYNGEIVYRDVSGNNVQITDNGGLNLASIGTIGGDYGQPGIPASAIYSDLTNAFIFTRDTGIGAVLSGSDLQLTHPVLSEQPITISAPAGVTAYDITLPDSAPTDNSSLLAVDINGDSTFTANINIKSVTLNTSTFATGYNLWFDSSNRLRINGDVGGVLFADSTNATTLLTLSNAGALAIGPTAGAVTHDVNGRLNFNTTEASLPANGIYRSASNTLAFSTNSTNVASVASGAWTLGTASGTAAHQVNGASLKLLSGNVGATLYLRNSTTGDAGGLQLQQSGLDASIQNVSAGSLSFSTNGVPSLEMSTTGANTIGPTSGAVENRVQGTLSFNTTESTPATNGIYRSAANTLAFSTNSTLSGTVASGVWSLGASGGTNTHVSNGNWQVTKSTEPTLFIAAGSDSSQILRDTADSYGIGSKALVFRDTTSSVSIVQGGASTGGVWKFGPSGNTSNHSFNGGIEVSGQVLPSAGSVSSPAFSFFGDTNLGLYRIGADNLGFSAAGVKVGEYSSTGAWTFGPPAQDNTHNFNGVIQLNGKTNGDAIFNLNATGAGDSAEVAFLLGGVNKWAIGRSPGEAPGNFNFYNYTIGKIVGYSMESTGQWKLGPGSYGFSTSNRELHLGCSSFAASNSTALASQNTALEITKNAGSGNNSAEADSCIIMNLSTGAATNPGYYWKGYNNTTLTCQVLYNGAFYGNGTYGSVSDATLKENIVDATPKLSDLMQVKIRNFNFKDSPTQEKHIGVIAQELEEIFPTLVEQDGEGIKRVKTSILLPIVVKAIQELKADNDEKQALIDEMYTKIENLTDRIEALETP